MLGNAVYADSFRLHFSTTTYCLTWPTMPLRPLYMTTYLRMRGHLDGGLLWVVILHLQTFQILLLSLFVGSICIICGAVITDLYRHFRL